MANSLTLKAITPAETLLDLPAVAWVQVELVDGSLGIRPGHAPLLGRTKRGPVRYGLPDGAEQVIEVEAGLLQIGRQEVTIFCSGLGAAEQSDVLPVADGLRFERLLGVLLSEKIFSSTNEH